MKTIACADVGMKDCPFVANGATEEEVMDNMKSHTKKEHPARVAELIMKMSFAEIDEALKKAIKEA